MLERRTFDHGVVALVSADLEARGIVVAFTERTGGVSDQPFDTLNLGFTRDDAARVRENRARVCTSLDVPPFARVWQVHGSRVVTIGPALADAGFAGPSTAIPNADGLITDHRGVALSILSADCVPVALVDPGGGRVGAVHAGWRGVAAGIVGEGLRRFADPAKVLGVIGPAVGPDHYEVGPEVVQAVTAAAGSAVVLSTGRATSLLDLPSTIAHMLETRGVRVVDRSDACTACEADRFFSYRRDGETGRQAMIVMRR